MSLISKNRLDKIHESVNLYERRQFLEKKFRMTEARQTGRITVFLSHSHKDKNLIEQAVVFLNSIGVDVYIDWKDENMPSITNATTAAKIKEKIKENKKFILLATEEAIKSNWVNWELGYGDAHKYINHIAILPITDYSGGWQESEYLGIYPYIEEISSWPYYIVTFPDHNQVSIADWLRQ